MMAAQKLQKIIGKSLQEKPCQPCFNNWACHSNMNIYCEKDESIKDNFSKVYGLQIEEGQEGHEWNGDIQFFHGGKKLRGM